MLRDFILCLLLSAEINARGMVEKGSAIEKKGPPNEWGTYYSLPAELTQMSDLFRFVYVDYFKHNNNSDFQCGKNDALFAKDARVPYSGRWYKSSENADHLLLSYYCTTKVNGEARGYEHMKVDQSEWRVLEFHTSLQSFGIVDIGHYNEGGVSEEFSRFTSEKLLAEVANDIAKQKFGTREMCPDPVAIIYTGRHKWENGLFYYRFTIGCNFTHVPTAISSIDNTSIEIVVDRKFEALNDGWPLLVTMDTHDFMKCSKPYKSAEIQKLDYRETFEAYLVCFSEWNTYYSLPAEKPTMEKLLLTAFAAYEKDDDRKKEFKCRKNEIDTTQLRYYKSMKDTRLINDDYVLLSYFCNSQNKTVQGYEHMKVSKVHKKVLQFETKLADFGIQNVEYNFTHFSPEYANFMKAKLVILVTKAIALQTDNRNGEELCPHPGTKTDNRVGFKQENGLYYFKFNVSCNIGRLPNSTISYASHKSNVEVVVDDEWGILNRGVPVLATMEIPIKKEKGEVKAVKSAAGVARKSD